MSTLSSPHDKFFKYLFGSPDRAKEFIAHYLPADLVALMAVDSLEVQKDTFVDSTLTERYSDLLFKVQLAGSPAYLYLLIEHKSSPDKFTALQLLTYMVQIWQRHREANLEGPLPIIIPIVVYHGEQAWTAGTRLSNLISPATETLARYLPDFTFELCDLNTLSDQNIIGGDALAFGLRLMKYVRAQDFPVYFRMMIGSWSGPLEGEIVRDYFTRVVFYIIHAAEQTTKEQIETILENSILHKEGEKLMTIAETLLKQGRLEGILIKSRKAVLQVLCIRFHDVPYQIREKLDSIDDPATLDDLHQYAVLCDSLPDFQAQLLR